MDLNRIGFKGRGCLVLGAGATRGASFLERAPVRLPLPPLDADFFTQIQRMTLLSNQQIAKRLLRFTVGEFGVGFKLTMEQFFTQVETLPQIFEQLRITKGRSYRQPASAMRWFRQALAAVFQESLITEIAGASVPHRCGYHTRLAGALNGQDTILSFNYDCLIEESLRMNCAAWDPRYSYGIPLYKTDVSYWAYQVPKKARPRRHFLRLLKMHGSMNWRRRGSKIELTDNAYVIDDDHAIVPPQWQKDVLAQKSGFRPIWRQARAGLESARCLIIAGYSAPMTDLLAQTLLRCRNRPSGKTIGSNQLEVLAIANPDRSARHHLIDLLKPSIDDQTRVLVFDSLAQCAAHLIEPL
jgi:SIR2-like domain